ncbi:MAG: DUF4258 domain-containing protein [Methylococcales bacterium]
MTPSPEELRISEHGYDELSADKLTVRELVVGAADAVVVEDYPDCRKGPCVLVLQRDKKGHPVHVVWGISAGNVSPAVLVTAYRPDPVRWDEKFRRRRR